MAASGYLFEPTRQRVAGKEFCIYHKFNFLFKGSRTKVATTPYFNCCVPLVEATSCTEVAPGFITLHGTK